jgi:hypothetical protein
MFGSAAAAAALWLVWFVSVSALPTIDCTTGVDLTYIGANNDDLSLTWSASYAMSGILDMLETTGDLCFAHMMVQYGDSVLQQADGKRFGNVSSAAHVWSHTTRIAPNRAADVVTTGMIIWPLVRFGVIVRRNASMIPLFGAKVRDFVTAAENAVAFFDDSWFNSELGAYRTPTSFPSFYMDSRNLSLNAFPALPLNMQLALGRALFDLFEVTGRSFYLQRAASLCRYFDAALTKTGSVATWLYWPHGNDPSIEDTSHGSIDADFAVMCFERGGWLSFATVTALANTLATVIFNGNEPTGGPRVALTVSGTSFAAASNTSERAVAGLWAALAPFNSALPNLLVSLVDSVLPDSAGPHYGYAFNTRTIVLRFASPKRANGAACTSDVQCHSNICFGGSVCGTWLGLTSSCRRHKECASGQCFQGVCAALLGPSSTCSAHDQCLSGLCNSARTPSSTDFWQSLLAPTTTTTTTATSASTSASTSTSTSLMLPFLSTNAKTSAAVVSHTLTLGEVGPTSATTRQLLSSAAWTCLLITQI